MCDDCFPQILTFEEFCTELCAFRERWSQESFWRESFRQRQQHIDRLLTFFGSMDGNVDQISAAGANLQAAILEYKLRNGLRLLR